MTVKSVDVTTYTGDPVEIEIALESGKRLAERTGQKMTVRDADSEVVRIFSKATQNKEAACLGHMRLCVNLLWITAYFHWRPAFSTALIEQADRSHVLVRWAACSNPRRVGDSL